MSGGRGRGPVAPVVRGEVLNRRRIQFE